MIPRRDVDRSRLTPTLTTAILRTQTWPPRPDREQPNLPAHHDTNAYLLRSLRLGYTAPNFQADTTNGPIDFHEFIGDSWVVLFSHPEDYTPVCTTELGAMAKLEPEFKKRGVKIIGLSANTLESHEGWIKDIDEVTGGAVTFPIIADKQRQVALLYDM